MGFKEAIEAMHDKVGIKAKGVDIVKEASTKGETLVEVFAKEYSQHPEEAQGRLEAVLPRVAQIDAHLRSAPMGTAVPAPAPALGPFASEDALQAWEALKTRLNGPRPFKGESTVAACTKRVDHLGRGLWELQAVLASPSMSNKAHYHKLAMEIAAQVDEMAEEAERRRPEGDEWAAIRTRLAELKRIALAIPVPASEPAIKPTSELFAREDAPDTSTLRCPCGSEFTWTLADPGLEPWIQAHHVHTLFTRFDTRFDNPNTNKSSSLKCSCGSTYTWVDPNRVPWADPWIELHRPHALAAKMAKIHMAKAQAKAKALAAPFVDTDSIISTIPKAEDLPPMPKMVEGPDAGYDQIWSTIKGAHRRLGELLALPTDTLTRQKDLREVHARLNGLLPVIAWMQGCSRQPATWAELATTAESLMRTARGALTPTRFETALAPPVDVDAAHPKDPKGTDFVLTRAEALEKVRVLEIALAKRTAERDQARRQLDAARQTIRALYAQSGVYGHAPHALKTEAECVDYGIDPEEVERLRSLGYHVAVVNAPKVPDDAKDAAVDTPPPANNQERVRRLVNAFEDIVQTPPDPAEPPYPAEKTVGRYARATMATPAAYPPAVPATLQKLLSEKQVYEAPTATPMNETQVAILAECDALAAMLLKKNKSYGNSALDPVRIFSRASAREQILVRLDDKLSRLSRAGGDHLGEDVILDILGYLILLRVQTRLGGTP